MGAGISEEYAEVLVAVLFRPFPRDKDEDESVGDHLLLCDS